MLRALAAGCAIALAAGPAAADGGAERLVETMRLAEVAEILRAEGLEYGRILSEDMLAGEGGALFDQTVANIYQTGPMVEIVGDALDENMSDKDIETSIRFFGGAIGQRILSLENSARRAFADDTIEDMARANWRSLPGDDPRLALIGEYIEVNNLKKRNVESAMRSEYAFLFGMADGQGVEVDTDSMLTGILDRRDETEAETEAWLFSFLLMAYQPLSDEDLRENIAFSRTGAGQALNQALFIGFDRMYDRISYELGLAVGQALGASDL